MNENHTSYQHQKMAWLCGFLRNSQFSTFVEKLFLTAVNAMWKRTEIMKTMY
jgi:hypothetical protein